MRRQQEGLKDPSLGGVLEAEGVAIWAGEIQPHIQVILTKARQGSAPRARPHGAHVLQSTRTETTGGAL